MNRPVTCRCHYPLRSPTTSPRVHPHYGAPAASSAVPGLSQIAGRRGSSSSSGRGGGGMRPGGLSKSVSFASPITQDLVAMAAMGGRQGSSRMSAASALRGSGSGIGGLLRRPTSSSAPSSPNGASGAGGGPSAVRPGLQDALLGLRAVKGGRSGGGAFSNAPPAVAPLPSAPLLMLSPRGDGGGLGGSSAGTSIPSPPSSPSPTLGQQYSGPRISPPKRNPDGSIALTLPFPPFVPAAALLRSQTSSLLPAGGGGSSWGVGRGPLLGSSGLRGPSGGSGIPRPPTLAEGGLGPPIDRHGNEAGIDLDEEDDIGLRELRNTVQRLSNLPR